MHVGDDRLAVGERAGKGWCAIDRDVVSAVAQHRRNHRDAVAHAAGQFGEGVVDVFIGNVVQTHGHIGVAARRRLVDLPGDLLDRHLHAVGDIAISGGCHIGRDIEGEVGHGLLARVEGEVQSGITDDSHDVLAADVEIIGHQQHLPRPAPVIEAAARAGILDGCF